MAWRYESFLIAGLEGLLRESYCRRISDAEQGRNTGNDQRTRKSRYSGLEAELLGDKGSCSKSGML